MIKVDLPEQWVTLEECSKDDDGNPVTHLQNEVLRFDDLSQKEADKYRRKKKLRSADGVYVNKRGTIFFFEFKNAPHSHISKNNIIEKMHDSILTWQVCRDANVSLEELAEKSIYFVIYNDSRYGGERENISPSMDKMKNKLGTLAQKANQENILWNTDIFLNSFYHEVHTIDVDVFEQKYVSHIFD